MQSVLSIRSTTSPHIPVFFTVGLPEESSDRWVHSCGKTYSLRKLLLTTKEQVYQLRLFLWNKVMLVKVVFSLRPLVVMTSRRHPFFKHMFTVTRSISDSCTVTLLICDVTLLTQILILWPRERKEAPANQTRRNMCRTGPESLRKVSLTLFLCCENPDPKNVCDCCGRLKRSLLSVDLRPQHHSCQDICSPKLRS